MAFNSIVYPADDLEIGQLVKVPFWPGFDEGEPWACGINVERLQNGYEFNLEQQQAAQQLSQENFIPDHWLAADIVFENLGYTETVIPQEYWSARLLPAEETNETAVAAEIKPYSLMKSQKLAIGDNAKFTILLHSTEAMKSGQFLQLSFHEMFMANALTLTHRL